MRSLSSIIRPASSPSGSAKSGRNAAIGIPGMILLAEYYFARELQLRWLVRHAGYSLVLAGGVIALVYAMIADSSVSTLRPLFAEPEGLDAGRMLLELRIAVFFLSLYFVPDPAALNLDHAFQVPTSLLNPLSTLGALILLCAVAAAAIFLARRAPVFSFGVLWFLVMLFTEAWLFGDEIAFEHRSYLPGVGIALAVAGALAPIARRWFVIALSGGVCMVVLLGAGTVVRNDVWRARLTLWTDVVQKAPSSALARNQLGQALVEAGRAEDAFTEFMEAVRLDGQLATPYNNMGVQQANEGQYRAALQHFRTAISIDPDYAEAYHNMGVTLINQRRFNAAIESFEIALRLDPRYASAHENLAFVYAVLGDQKRRCMHLSAALRADPRLQKVREKLEDCTALE